MGNYTVDWFSNNIGNIQNCLNYEVKKALEIGCYEGRSSCWFLQNDYFKNVDIYFIDIWEEDSLYNIFNNNINESKKDNQNINIFIDTSDSILLNLLEQDQNTFDFIYIDGNHQAEQVYRDGCSSFKLLKSNGIIIFDDYLIDYTGAPEYAHYGYPKAGVDQFLLEHKEQLEVVLLDYQVIIRKL